MVIRENGVRDFATRAKVI